MAHYNFKKIIVVPQATVSNCENTINSHRFVVIMIKFGLQHSRCAPVHVYSNRIECKPPCANQHVGLGPVGSPLVDRSLPKTILLFLFNYVYIYIFVYPKFVLQLSWFAKCIIECSFGSSVGPAVNRHPCVSKV